MPIAVLVWTLLAGSPIESASATQWPLEYCDVEACARRPVRLDHLDQYVAIELEEIEDEASPGAHSVDPASVRARALLTRRQSELGSKEFSFLQERLVEPPLEMVDIALGPLREANLLLPQKLDPLAAETRTPLVPYLMEGTPTVETESFTSKEQEKLLGSLSSTAPIDPSAPKGAWRYQVQGGGSFRQGNTSASNVNAQLQAERFTDASDFLFKMGAVYNNNGVVRPNRRFYGSSLYDRALRGRWLAYGKEELESDQASLVDLRSVTSVGLGFKFINKLKSRLVIRSGPTFSYVRFASTQNTPDVRGGWMVESDYRRILWDAVRFEWTAGLFPDFETEQQFRFRNEVALIFPIGGKTSRWNWKLGGRQFYQYDPVKGARPSDVEAYFTILYQR